MSLDAFIASTSLVTIAEIGDKTQLLSLMLVARYRKPVPIILAILVATLFNHALAAAFGHTLTTLIDPVWFQWGVAISFIALGLWALVPDTLDEGEGNCNKREWGAFVTSAVCFFFAEMGDKTQVATVVLGAQYSSLVQVVAGTTLGMMIANIPAVLCGEALLKRIPLQKVRYIAAVLFIGSGIWAMGDLIHAV